MKVGIVCYASVGGSGVIASELGKTLAARGHRVHILSSDTPFRLGDYQPGLSFHRVETPTYPLFREPQYLLSLANKIVQVARDERLEIVHAHYAIPHATAANLARQVLASTTPAGERVPRVITTLHGTDITLLARDRSLGPIIKYSIESSCGVTAVSRSLKAETIQVLKTRKPIEVIYNFYRPKPPRKGRAEVRRALRVRDSDFLLIHLSNLRPVKRVPDVLQVVADLKDQGNIKLLVLAGESFAPFRPLVKRLGIEDRVIVKENVLDIENYLHAADGGLYASEKESFGMGVLETMSFGKPVVATRVGGVAEIVKDKRTGFLARLGDVKSMAAAVRCLAADPALAERMGAAARSRAEQEFSSQKSVEQYLDLYRRTIRDCKD
jgi:N-acetyl-alpha-D-glucosaminyl L-malate synthase BshA